MTATLNITIAQTNPIVGNIGYNIEKIEKILRDAPPQTDLVVFPELAVTGYPPEDLILKPFFLDEVAAAVQALLKRVKNLKCAFLLPVPWRMEGKTYNCALVVDGGAIVHVVRKSNLPNYGVFDERRVFAAAPLPTAVNFRGHRIGVMICEDMWTDDAALRLMETDAEMLIVVNASPYESTKHSRRMELARERVQATDLPLIYVNQVGGQDELVFDGASFIMTESGQVLLQAEEFVESVHHTSWRKTGSGSWICAPAEIHEPHERIEAIYQAVMTGLRDYVSKNGFPGVLIGMSGGIDSAISAAIAVDALGADAVHCIMMPSQYTSKESLEDAEECAKLLGVHYEVLPIEKPVDAFENLLATHFNTDTPSITHENMQSRARGMILMALSNATGRMVLSTGNKSEMAVGYATLYGDMCGGFNALKDIYKTDIFRMARMRNEKKPDHCFGPEGVVIPDRIITKPPSAELKPGQTDQDTLPPYDVLDDILSGLIERDLSLEEIAAHGHDPALIRRVWGMLDIAEYKRRQAPPGVKITARAFGRDRRYPITNGFIRYLREKA